MSRMGNRQSGTSSSCVQRCASAKIVKELETKLTSAHSRIQTYEETERKLLWEMDQWKHTARTAENSLSLREIWTQEDNNTQKKKTELAEWSCKKAEERHNRMEAWFKVELAKTNNKVSEKCDEIFKMMDKHGETEYFLRQQLHRAYMGLLVPQDVSNLLASTGNVHQTGQLRMAETRAEIAEEREKIANEEAQRVVTSLQRELDESERRLTEQQAHYEETTQNNNRLNELELQKANKRVIVAETRLKEIQENWSANVSRDNYKDLYEATSLKLKAADESLSGAQQHIVKLKERLDLLTGRYSRTQSEIKNLMKRNTEYESEVRVLHDKLNAFVEREKELAQTIEDFRTEKYALQDKITSFTSRWGRMMGEKSSQDEMNHENLNIDSRPLVLKDRYKLLCGSTVKVRKQLQSCLVKHTGLKKEDVDEFCHKTVCAVVQHSYELVLMVYGSIMSDLAKLFSQPVQEWTKRNQEGKLESQRRRSHLKDHTTMDDSPQPTPEMDTSLSHELNNYLRSRADVQLTSLTENVQTQVLHEITKSTSVGLHYRSYAITAVMETEQLNQLLKSSCELAWQMVLQQPSMSFRQSGVGAPHHDVSQELFYGLRCRPDDEGAVVHYYLQPTLLQADKVIMKGVVTLEVGRQQKGDSKRPRTENC